MTEEQFELLLTKGVTVFEIGIPEELEELFDKSFEEQPELLRNGNLIEEDLVGGGFAALGNASSFHNRAVRALRKLVLDDLKKAIIKADKYQGKKIEIVPDRMGYRKKGKTPTAESWHRDLTPLGLTNINTSVAAIEGDIIFGGWINCNTDKTQHFICVTGTHLAETEGVGFALIKKEESEYYKQIQVDVEIPPGHVLLFNQTLVHCVNPTVLDYDMKRIYVGYRLTSGDNYIPLIKDIMERLEAGKVIPLKSGQIPSMYPNLYIANWPDKLIKLTKGFKDKEYMLDPEEKDFSTHKRLLKLGSAEYPAAKHRVIKAIAPDMQSQFSYTPQEKSLYLPHFIYPI